MFKLCSGLRAWVNAKTSKLIAVIGEFFCGVFLLSFGAVHLYNVL